MSFSIDMIFQFLPTTQFRISGFYVEMNRLPNGTVRISPELRRAMKPIHKAAADGNIPELQRLLAEGANVNEPMHAYINYTPLSIAISLCNSEVVDELLKVPELDVNKTFRSDEGTPLYIAVERAWFTKMDACTHIVRSLLQDPRTDKNKGLFQESPLLHAVRRHLPEIVQMFVEYPDVDVNKADTNDQYPLYDAILDKYYDIAFILLQRPDIDLNKVGPFNDTPLSLTLKNIRGTTNNNNAFNLAEAIIHKSPLTIESLSPTLIQKLSPAAKAFANRHLQARSREVHGALTQSPGEEPSYLNTLHTNLAPHITQYVTGQRPRNYLPGRHNRKGRKSRKQQNQRKTRKYRK